MFWGFFGNIHSLHYFRTLSKKTNWVLAESFRSACQTATNTEEHFGGNFLENTNFLLRFRDFEPNFLQLLTKAIQQVCQNCSLRQQRSVLILFSGKVIFFSWFLDFTFRKLSNFWRKKLASLSQLQIGCPGEEFKGKYFLKKNKVPHLFRILSENISDFWQKIFSRAFKTAVYVYRGTFQYCFS